MKSGLNRGGTRFRYGSSSMRTKFNDCLQIERPLSTGYKSGDLSEQSHPSAARSSKVGWIVTERRPNSHTPLLHGATEWVDCG